MRAVLCANWIPGKKTAESLNLDRIVGFTWIGIRD